MNTAKFLVVIVSAALSIATVADEGKAGKPTNSDNQQIQGTWKVVGCYGNSKVASPEFIEEHPSTMKFAGSSVTTSEKTTATTQTTTEATFVLDPSKSPKQITLTAATGPLKDHPGTFIYELEKDSLKVAFGAGNSLPNGFDNKDGVQVMVLERQKEKGK